MEQLDFNPILDAERVEYYCMVWVAGCEDFEWWNKLPCYEKESYMHMYEAYPPPRPKFSTIMTAVKVRVEQDRAIAKLWAKEIKEAWLKKEPCPITPAPGKEYLLRMALDYLNISPQKGGSICEQNYGG